MSAEATDSKALNDQTCIVSVAATTCLGVDIASTWRGVEDGRCGIGQMSALESPLPAGRDGGQALPLPPEFAPDLPREARYLRWTIAAALRDGKIDLAALAPGRISIVLGTTLHGMRAGGAFLRTGDYSKLKAFLAGDVTRLAARGLPIGGASLTTCSACSSSLGAVALGVTLLRANEADLIIAGGYDAISEYAYAGFDALRLISEAPLRPFARGRAGMKVSEGYGIVVMMRYGDAERLGHTPLAIVAGCGESADAFHLTRPHPDGIGALAAMRQACRRAGIAPRDLNLIAAHATGTIENDKSEAAALVALLGDDSRRVPVVGFKSHLGHTLGGAGAVELALSVEAIHHGILPPTANPCDVEYDALTINTERRAAKITHTLNTSLGFGGANTCIVLRAYSPSPGTPEKGRGEGLQQPSSVAAAQPKRGRDGDVVITGIGVLLPKSGRTIDDSEYEAIVPNARRMRRMSPYVKLSIAAATLAVRDAKLLDSPELLRDASAILGTLHGSAGYCYDYYAQIVSEGMAAANPMLFAEGVPNAAAAQLSLALGLCGACQTILGTTTAGLDALRLASLRIAAGEAERVIVCAAEESHPVLDAAYAAICFEEPDTSMSVAVAFVVESRTSAQQRGAKPMATLTSGSFSTEVEGEGLARLARRSGAHSGSLPRLRGTPIDLEGAAFSVEPLLALAHAISDPSSCSWPLEVLARHAGVTRIAVDRP